MCQRITQNHSHKKTYSTGQYQFKRASVVHAFETNGRFLKTNYSSRWSGPNLFKRLVPIVRGYQKRIFEGEMRGWKITSKYQGMSPEEKFKNVSIESDTKIHAIKYLNLDGTDCRYEFWEWDGVEAESLIFSTPELKEVTEAYFQKLIGLISNTTAAEPRKFTSKSGPEYTYLNFNFNVK